LRRKGHGAALPIVGGAHQRTKENAIPTFSPPKPLESPKTAKKSFGKIWKSFGGRLAASLIGKDFFPTRNLAKQLFLRNPRIFQMFAAAVGPS
jgi:hypothetical protein